MGRRERGTRKVSAALPGLHSCFVGRRGKGGLGCMGNGGEEGKVAVILFLIQKLGKALE